MNPVTTCVYAGWPSFAGMSNENTHNRPFAELLHDNTREKGERYTTVNHYIAKPSLRKSTIMGPCNNLRD